MIIIKKDSLLPPAPLLSLEGEEGEEHTLESHNSNEKAIKIRKFQRG